MPISCCFFQNSISFAKLQAAVISRWSSTGDKTPLVPFDLVAKANRHVAEVKGQSDNDGRRLDESCPFISCQRTLRRARHARLVMPGTLSTLGLMKMLSARPPTKFLSHPGGVLLDPMGLGCPPTNKIIRAVKTPNRLIDAE